MGITKNVASVHERSPEQQKTESKFRKEITVVKIYWVIKSNARYFSDLAHAIKPFAVQISVSCD